MEEQRELVIGGVVVFIDQHRIEHRALVNCIHGDQLGRQVVPRRKPNPNPKGSDDTYIYETDDDGVILNDYVEPGEHWPCINLVIVSPNPDCQDPYGRQLERHTSVVHQSNSSAVGYCFRFEDERLMTELRQPTVS
jgi:hypothetical protein